MAEVVLHHNENLESLLKRFNKRVQMEGIISEANRREFYEKPSVRRKRKEACRRRKSLRASVVS